MCVTYKNNLYSSFLFSSLLSFFVFLNSSPPSFTSSFHLPPLLSSLLLALPGSNHINKVVSHPTLPVTITAHEDRHIKFYDNKSGQSALLSLSVRPTLITIHEPPFIPSFPSAYKVGFSFLL